MNRKQSSKLDEELASVGASKAEAEQLRGIAEKIEGLKAKPAKIIQDPKRNSRFFRLMPIGVTALAGLVIGIFLVIYSQTVLPGSWAYSVQTVSQKVAISLNHNYRGAVMMQRAQQVKQLVNNHASSQTVLATLASYQQEASAYKSTSENYAAFEYCKSNLAQAENRASPTVKQAIIATLSNIKSV